MPRYPVVEKTIQGKPIAHHLFLSAILDQGKHPNGTRVCDLVEAFGPEWNSAAGKKYLATALSNLANRGVIRRDAEERGRYHTTNQGKRNGATKFDADEKSILAVLRQHGGFARFRDIAEAHDVRPHGPDARDTYIHPVYQRIVNVLRASTIIRNDTLVRGLYNLPWDELATYPLRGKYAALLIKEMWEEVRRDHGAGDPRPIEEMHPHVQSWRFVRDNYFSCVGEAFKLLRMTKGVTIPQMMDDLKVRSALSEFQRVAPMEVQVIRQDWSDRSFLKVEEMKAAGASPGDILDYREERERELITKLPEWLYKRFERGSLGAHVNAPLSFYIAVAEYFDCCPASLSRGLTVLKPWDERTRVGTVRRPAIEIALHEADNEVALERNREFWETLMDADVEVDLTSS